MNSQKVLYNKIGDDENYTPSYAVVPIIKHLPKGKVIWCPFDLSESEYVIELKKAGFKVINSHIEMGEDFFFYEPKEHWDIIVSNPPFKNKRLFFERALSFKKPFALLMTNAWLNDKYSKWVFKEANRQMQLLMFDKRVHFIKPNGEVIKKTTFSSSYFCSGILKNDIIIEELIMLK